ncbi:MAG: HAD hydrolase-like protein, partial [Bdellovibrionota bacterium]
MQSEINPLPSGILFDLDGTLIQSLEQHCAAWKHALAEIGLSFNDSDYYVLEGAPLLDIARTLVAKGFSVTP